MENIVILGNGIAALTAAETFRKHSRDCPVTIVSQEPYYAYYRPRLSKLLGREPKEEGLLIHPPGWYEENRIRVILGKKAERVDFKNHLVHLEGGQALEFSKLLIATGSSPFIPPVPGHNLKGVFAIRTLNDVKRLYEYAKDSRTGTVIGGGVLGLEAAWNLAKSGKKIYVIETAPYILPRQLDEKASELLKALGEKAGISFVLSGKSEAIEGEQKAEGVLLQGGNMLQTDFVIFSTGVRPNTQIFDPAEISINRGVIVDEYMRTSREGVYAAGDVAEYNGKVPGIWPVAQEQGRIAGMNLAGIATPYSEVVPSNYIHVFDTEIFSAGDLCKEEKADYELTDIDRDRGIYRKIFFKGGQPVGAILLGNVKGGNKISKAIKAGVRFDNLSEIRNFDEFLQKLEG